MWVILHQSVSILCSPLQYSRCPLSGSFEIFPSRTAILYGPLQHFKVSILCSITTSEFIQGQSFSQHHFNTSKCPFDAAIAQVYSFHGHPFSLAHFSSSSFPLITVSEQTCHPKGIIISCPLQYLKHMNKQIHSMDSHSLWTTSTLLGVHSLQHNNSEVIPRTAILSGPPPGVHLMQHLNKHLCSNGSHPLWPTSTHERVHSMQHFHKLIHPKDSQTLQPTSMLQGVHSMQHNKNWVHPSNYSYEINNNNKQM